MTSFTVHLSAEGQAAASFDVEAHGVVCSDHWLMFDAGGDGRPDQLVAAVPRERVLYVEQMRAPGLDSRLVHDQDPAER